MVNLLTYIFHLHINKREALLASIFSCDSSHQILLPFSSVFGLHQLLSDSCAAKCFTTLTSYLLTLTTSL